MDSYSPHLIQDYFLYVLAIKHLLPQSLDNILNEINEYSLSLLSCDPYDLPKTVNVGSLLYRYCVGLGTLINLSRDKTYEYVRNDLETFFTCSPKKTLNLLPKKTTQYDMNISLTEAFNGCIIHPIINDKEYNITIPKYSINGYSTCIDNVNITIGVRPESNYAVFDDILFKCIQPINEETVIELPDTTTKTIIGKDIKEHGYVDVKGYPFRVSVVFETPISLMKSALSGNLQHLTGKSAIFCSWDTSLFQTTSILRQQLAESILMTFNVEKTNTIERFEMSEDTASIALKYKDHSVAATLTHALKYSNQTYVISTPTMPRPIFISTLSPISYVRGDIYVELPILCIGGDVHHDEYDIEVHIERCTPVGSIIVKKTDKETYVLVVKEKPSAYIRNGDDILTSIELDITNDNDQVETTLTTLTGQVIQCKCQLNKVFRIVGGGIPLEHGYGDLIVTFTTKPQIIKEKEYLQLIKTCEYHSIHYQPFILFEKLLNSGVIPKIYKIPPNPNTSSKKKPFYVKYVADGYSNNEKLVDLVLVINPPE
ncbi:Chaperone DnaJ C-terminal domain-containing protein [Entamoeba marina]